jgi:hypothetical protein
MTLVYILVVLFLNDGPRAPAFQTFQTEIACNTAKDKINARSKHFTAFCVEDGVVEVAQ